MKTHLLDSSDPIIEGQTQTAICGATVNQARFVFMWDEVAVGSGGLSYAVEGLTVLCRKCRKVAEFSGPYIYGICNGEEMKQRGLMGKETDKSNAFWEADAMVSELISTNCDCDHCCNTIERIREALQKAAGGGAGEITQ